MNSLKSRILDSCTLIYVDVGENSNKVWQGSISDDGSFIASWGRVGDRLQSKTYYFNSVILAQTKFDRAKRQKLRKGYSEAPVIDVNYCAKTTLNPEDLETIAAKQIQHGEDPRSKALIRYLVEVNIHEIISQTDITYNSNNGNFKTALGLVTPKAIAMARDYLIQIAETRRSNTYKLRQLISDYLRLIPQNLGRKLDESVFCSAGELQRQYEILNALDAAVTNNNSSIFECTIKRVPGSTIEGKKIFREIRQLYESTINNNHQSATYQLRRVYEVDIPSMNRAFAAKSAEIGNIKRHWHGTKASNLLSILQRGLIIPPANAIQCTGRMFGNGIYGSEQSTKALNYATNYWNQSGDSTQKIFMLLCDFAMGKEYHPQGYGQNLPKPGYDSTYVAPQTANTINQESIVYSIEQVNIKYLCEFI
jgi:poly [ADP-ribose] polymerase